MCQPMIIFSNGASTAVCFFVFLCDRSAQDRFPSSSPLSKYLPPPSSVLLHFLLQQRTFCPGALAVGEGGWGSLFHDRKVWLPPPHRHAPMRQGGGL